MNPSISASPRKSVDAERGLQTPAAKALFRSLTFCALSLAAFVAMPVASHAAAEPARPTTPADNRAGPVNDCARITGADRDRCDRERGYGSATQVARPVGNMDRPPSSPTTAPRSTAGF